MTLISLPHWPLIAAASNWQGAVCPTAHTREGAARVAVRGPGLPALLLHRLFFFPIVFLRVWEEAQLQQGGLEILGSTPCSQKVLVGRQRTSDTQRNKDKCFGGWHLADTTWKMTWLFCWKRLVGGAAKGGESPGNDEGKTASFLIGSGFLKRMGERRPGCRKRRRELSVFATS